LALLIDIDENAAANEFRLGFSDLGAVTAFDKNSGQIVSIDSGITFPLFTAFCKIKDPVNRLAISQVPLNAVAANLGQNDLEALRLQLRHPGIIGSSQIQLTRLSQMFTSESGDTIVASNLVERLRIADRHGNILGESFGAGLDKRMVNVNLNSPLTLSWGTVDTVHVLASIRDETIIEAFSLAIPDSSLIMARDLSSGQTVQTVTDSLLATGTVFPIASNLITLMQPAQPPQLCLSDLLPVDVIGGQDSLGLLDVLLTYQVPSTFSSVKLTDARIDVLDSLGRFLNPAVLFDRIGYDLPGQGMSYQPTFESQSGIMVFQFGDEGLVIHPGDSLAVRLVADIEGDGPYDHFMLSLHSLSAIGMEDVTDSVNQPVPNLLTTCSGSFPMYFGPTNISLPAGRPRIQLAPSEMRLAYAGQTDIDILNASLIYSGLTQQGDLDLNRVTGVVRKRTADGFVDVPSGSVFSEVRLLANDSVVAVDSVMAADSVVLTPALALVISSGSTVSLSLSGDLSREAEIGNYVVQFVDSVFIEFIDRYLSSAITPILVGAVYPLKSAEISVAGATLENSFSNYPNPFYPSRGQITTFAYVLDEDAYVDLELFSTTGDRVVQIVANEFHTAGPHQNETWRGINGRGDNVAPGAYFCRISVRYVSGREESVVRKVAVIR
jgi:hypothetical protein